MYANIMHSYATDHLTPQPGRLQVSRHLQFNNDQQKVEHLRISLSLDLSFTGYIQNKVYIGFTDNGFMKKNLPHMFFPISTLK